MKLLATLFLIASLSSLAAFGADKKASGPAWDSPEAVDTRVKELHDKLKITEAQETQWKAVTQEMHESAKSLRETIKSREGNEKAMSALDDLKSYAEIASLHAEGMKKFVDVFTPLYNSMSDEQKKNADDVFRGHKEGRKKQK